MEWLALLFFAAAAIGWLFFFLLVGESNRIYKELAKEKEFRLAFQSSETIWRFIGNRIKDYQNAIAKVAQLKLESAITDLTSFQNSYEGVINRVAAAKQDLERVKGVAVGMGYDLPSDAECLKAYEEYEEWQKTLQSVRQRAAAGTPEDVSRSMDRGGL